MKSILQKRRKVGIGSFQNQVLAEKYLSHTSDDVLHSMYERVEMMRLVGQDLSGKSVLLAGSGPGFYAKLLLDIHTDFVACIDNSQEMHRLAQLELHGSLSYILHDLNQPINISPNTFDLVVSPLTVHYIRDWHQLFSNFYRILKPHGRLLFSTLSPAANIGVDYHATNAFWQHFRKLGVKVAQYRRPISACINPLLENGFLLESVVEPKPSEAIKAVSPALFEAISTKPMFIFFDARKP